MKIAYLILAHKNPAHLARIISRLNVPEVRFYIHIDRKSNIQKFYIQTETLNADIYYCNKREDGRWGGFGLVKATLSLIQLAAADLPDYYILLSGMDYPIKSNSVIRDFLMQNNGKGFIESLPIPNDKIDCNGINRTECYSYNFFGKRSTYIPYRLHPVFSLRGHIINLLLGVVSMFRGKRQAPENIQTFFFGSQWWVLHRHQIEYILNFIHENSAYLMFHKHTLIPDEVFFQTILFNNQSRVNDITSPNCHYIQWDSQRNHPLFLGEEQFDLLKKSEALFARKFQEDSLVLDMIDHFLLQEECNK